MGPSFSSENPQQDISTELENLLQQSIPDAVSSGIRFLDYLVDLIVIYVINVCLNAFLLMRLGAVFLGAYLLWYYLLFFAYYALLEGLTKGRTFGKMTTGTVAIREDGTRFTFGDALVRSLCRLVPFEPFSGFGHPWHDTWTKTRVVKRSALA